MSHAEGSSHQVERTGAGVGKTRSPWGGWLLNLVTLGIYMIFYHFYINREMRDHYPSVKVSPGWAAFAMLVPIANLVSVYNTGKRLAQVQELAGVRNSTSGGMGLLLYIVLGMNIPYYTNRLNEVWATEQADASTTSSAA